MLGIAFALLGRVWFMFVAPVDMGTMKGNAATGSERACRGQKRSLERARLLRPWSLRGALREREKTSQIDLFAKGSLSGFGTGLSLL